MSDEVKNGGQKWLILTIAAIFLIEAFVLAAYMRGGSLTDVLASSPSQGSQELIVGEYDIHSKAFDDITVKIEMSVYARLPKASSSDFTNALESNRHRVDEAIFHVLRTADHIEIHEPTLHSLRRRVGAALKRVLGKHMAAVEELIVPQFQVNLL